MESKETLICPLCEDETLVYRSEEATHVWICEICPAILFEYWFDEDIKGLEKTIK